MRQLLVAFVAAAALVASQNSAHAVFVKVVIDEFNLPAAPAVDQSGANSSRDISADSDVAVMRTLGVSTGGLTIQGAGAGRMGIGQAAGDLTQIVYTLANTAFLATDPVVYLTDLVANDDVMTDLIVRMYVNDGMTESLYDTATYDGATGGPQNLKFVNLALAGDPYTSIRFEFEPVDAFWSGSAENIVANPEPATMALMGLGVLGGAIGYRRRRKDDEVAPVEA